MSRPGRTQSPADEAPKSSRDGKLFGYDRNTVMIIGIVVVALILVLIWWSMRPKKTTEPSKRVIVNNGCKTDAECPTDKHCKASSGLCVGCIADTQCVGNADGTICDMATNKCVECAVSADCQEGQQCINKVCSPEIVV